VLFDTVLVCWLFEFYALLNKLDECEIFSEHCKKRSRDKKENSQKLLWRKVIRLQHLKWYIIYKVYTDLWMGPLVNMSGIWGTGCLKILFVHVDINTANSKTLDVSVRIVLYSLTQLINISNLTPYFILQVYFPSYPLNPLKRSIYFCIQ